MPGDRFYHTKRWKRLRAAALRRDLFTCIVPGCNESAYVVDHIIARRAGGTDTLDNLRSLCKAHDNAVKETSSGERRSAGKLVVKGCFADGSPHDPSHPWHTGGPRMGVQSLKSQPPETDAPYTKKVSFGARRWD